MTTIQWTEAAQADLRAVHAFIAKDSLRYAGRVIERVRRSVERLGRFPGSGTRVLEWDRPDLREILVGSYRVIYRLDGRNVAVLAVVHAASQLPEEPVP